MSDHPEITITVHGAVGIGKSAVALAILDALRPLGVPCEWAEEFGERNMGTGAEEIAGLEPKPTVRLVETYEGQAREDVDVDGLRDSLEQVRARAAEGLRMLWLVVREAGAPDGVTIPMRAMAATDWSTCALRRDDDLATGGVRLVAVSRGEAVSPRRTQHQAMHQQLLDMLGASDHQGAAARIGELAGLELLLTTGGAGRGVTAIAQERRRQIEGERFDPTADQQYHQGELAQAAACYVRLEAMRSVAATVPGTAVDDRVPPEWPWARCWWKPKDRRSNLVRAGALIAAELDRMDREGAANA